MLTRGPGSPSLRSSRLAIICSFLAGIPFLGAAGASPMPEPPRPTSQPASQPASQPTTKPASEPAITTPAKAKSPAPSTTGKRVPQVAFREWTKTREAASPKDDQDQIALGRLTYGRVDLTCDDTKVGESIRALCDALGLNLAMKFDIEFVDDTPVFLELTNVDGLAALEAIIDQGGTNGTWQLRRGILEVGSRTFLSRSNARRSQLYDVSTLVFDVPYVPAGDIAPPDLSMPGARNQTFRPQFTLGPDPETYRRKSPVELAADLMQAIVNQVEPEAWQPQPEGDGTEGTKGPPPKLPPSSGSRNHGQRNQSTLGDRNFDAGIGPPFVRGKWAAMDYYRQGAHLIVSAPDFVHRGIGGYPEPLPVAP